MKKSRRIWWTSAGLLVFAGIILWAGEAMYGEDKGKAPVVAYFCLGGGLLTGILLTIEWIVGVQKNSSSKKDKEKRQKFCQEGQRLLKGKDAAVTKESGKYWSNLWDKHRAQCPVCRK